MYGLFSELPRDRKVAYGAKAHFKRGALEIFYDKIDCVGHNEPTFKLFVNYFDNIFKQVEKNCKKWSTGPLCPKSKEIKIVYQDDKIIVKASMEGTKDWLYLIAYPY
jgi:trehalose utilization protein